MKVNNFILGIRMFKYMQVTPLGVIGSVAVLEALSTSDLKECDKHESLTSDELVESKIESVNGGRELMQTHASHVQQEFKERNWCNDSPLHFQW